MFQKKWLVNKIGNKALGEALSQFAKGRLIDIGCGDKPHKDMVAPYVSEHVGVDHEDTTHDKSNVDLIGTAYRVPVEDAYFNTALCTAVLEHLEEPNQAIKETSRILKKGSYAIYTVPLVWHLHEEPRDFYRYTKYGLKYLFEKNGFKIVVLKALAGFWVTFGQELVYYLLRFRKGGKLNPRWWIIPIVGIAIQATSYFLNKFDHSEGFTWAYLVVAQKR